MKDEWRKTSKKEAIVIDIFRQVFFSVVSPSMIDAFV
jgi:hypothetical protein